MTLGPTLVDILVHLMFIAPTIFASMCPTNDRTFTAGSTGISSCKCKTGFWMNSANTPACEVFHAALFLLLWYSDCLSGAPARLHVDFTFSCDWHYSHRYALTIPTPRPAAPQKLPACATLDFMDRQRDARYPFRILSISTICDTLTVSLVPQQDYM